MKYKKGLVFICLIICLFSIAAVSASDLNETMSMNDDQTTDFTEIDDEIDDVLAVEEQDLDGMGLTDDNELGVSPGTFTDLAREVTNIDGELILNRDYKFDPNFDYHYKTYKINIWNSSIVLNGNGHTIDCNNQSRAFEFFGVNTTVKNLIIINGFANYTHAGAISFRNSNCSLINCTFINNYATSGAGAIHLEKDNQKIINCTFINNSAIRYDSIIASGGAIEGYSSCSNCIISNCLFINNKAHYAGAIWWLGSDSIISNCTFINNTNTKNDFYRGVVDLAGDNIILMDSCFVNSTFYDIDSRSNNNLIIDCNYSTSNLPVLQKSFINISAKNNIDFNELVKLNISVTSGATGNISIYVNDIFKKYIDVADSCYLSDLNIGVNRIMVVYNGDNYYAASKNTTIVIVNKINTNMTVIPIELIYDNLTFSITLNNKATGEITVIINNKNYTESLKNGQATVIIQDVLDVGNYNYNVTYGGDQNFNTNSISGEITTQQKESNIDIFVKDIYVGEEPFIEYNIRNLTGTLSIYVNDLFVKNVSVGNDIKLDNLKEAGNYTINVFYSGNEYYKGSNSTTILKIYKFEPNLSFNNNNILGENVPIDVIFDNDATGYINITFGEYFYSNCELINGKTKVIIPILKGGWNEYSLAYSGSPKYNSIKKNNTTYFSFYEAPITLEIHEITWGDSLFINPSLPKGTTGTLEILIDNQSVYNMTIGESFAYKALNGGKHYLTVKYSGNDYFDKNESTFEFIVNRLNSTLIINNTIDANPTSNIVVKLKEDATGMVTVNIGNRKYSNYLVNGTFAFNTNKLVEGINIVSINYTGDNKYNPFYTVEEINVILKNPNLIYNTNNIILGNGLIIKPTVVSGATGTFEIYVDNELKRTINVGSSYSLYQQSIGKHEIKIIYSGDSYFKSDNVTTLFRVFSKYPIESNDMKIVYGTNKHFQAKFYDEYGNLLINKYVIFNVNGEDISVRTDSNGIAILNRNLSIGDYNITTINPTANENTTNNLLIFTSVESNDTYVNSHTDFDFNVTFFDNDADKLINIPILFKINGEDKVVTTNAEGVATLKLNLDIGVYDIISINTVTDENKTNKLFIKSNSTGKYTRDIDDKDMTIPSLDGATGKSVTVILPNDVTGIITLNIHGKNYDFDLVGGVANVKVPEFANGVYPYSITYSGDHWYSEFNKTGTLVVKNIIQTIISTSNLNTVYNGGKYLFATLKDINGKPLAGVQISINLDGIKYLTTDNEGQVKLFTNGLAPNTYLATITFAGNNYYAKCTMSVKVTVTKTIPKLTAKAKTFKKSVKTKKYSITLKTNQNKPMKNVKVTIKINKKTYKATTNAKGKATFKIKKLTKKGTFKSTVTFKGNTYYNKVTKKVKIKIK